MPTKILVINSSTNKQSLLLGAFKELEQKNFSVSIWSPSLNFISQFKENRWPAKKIFFGPNLSNRFNRLLFIAALPFLQLKILVRLINLKIKHQVEVIICLNINEKIVATALARLLRLKIIWLEAPDLNYRRINKFLLGLYKINSEFAKLIVFNNYAGAQLTRLGFSGNNIKLVRPGAKLNQYQDNIFNKLAALTQANFHRKYFTVGVITELNQKQKIESLLQAIKSCLPVIPNLQLIIIGEGQERKSLLWLAKKMGIENLAWLVGEQEQLKKWLDSFDVFLTVNEFPTLDDYGNILEAMAAGLPALGPRNIGLEDLIIENKTGYLIEPGNNEMLARQIIKLHQDKTLRLHLGKNGRERVNQLFALNQMAEALEKILKD